MASQKDIFAVMSRDEIFTMVETFKLHLKQQGVPVQKIYLYGSYAKGNPRYGSDIDLCVISSAFKDRFEANLMLRREAIKIDPRIEPVAYHPTQFQDWIPLVWEIENYGIDCMQKMISLHTGT